MIGLMLKMPKTKPNLYTFVPRSIFKTLLAVAILLILVVAGGLFYTWYMGRNGGGFVESATDPPKKEEPPIKQPTKPPLGANVGVSVQSLSSPLAPGSEATIMARTLPEVDCKIAVEYNKVASKDPGLIAKTSDEYGMVRWSWYVEDAVPEGKWPVDVTCTYGEKSGMVRGDLVVEVPKD